MQEAAVKCLFTIVYGPIGGGGDLTGVAIPAAAGGAFPAAGGGGGDPTGGTVGGAVPTGGDRAGLELI